MQQSYSETIQKNSYRLLLHADYNELTEEIQSKDLIMRSG